MQGKILIVEDDKALQSVLSDFLKQEGFITETASTGASALSIIDKSPPALVLLDLGLPDIQGESVLQSIRESYAGLPVVILTAKSKPQEIAAGLNLGADDYLAKPFAAEELLARINARIKGPHDQDEIIKLDDLVVDVSRITVKRGKKKINLTKTEFELLKYLLKNKGRVVSRDSILNNVWGYTSDVETRVVDVYIGYLKKKIDSKSEKKLIKNKRGFGYLIDD
jgi:DNA-binding response OmpR family regulator